MRIESIGLCHYSPELRWVHFISLPQIFSIGHFTLHLLEIGHLFVLSIPIYLAIFYHISKITHFLTSVRTLYYYSLWAKKTRIPWAISVDKCPGADKDDCIRGRGSDYFLSCHRSHSATLYMVSYV